MKFASLLGAASVLFAASALHAAAVGVVTVNEFGVGSYTDPLGNVSALTFTVASDPGPGGLASVLKYTLPAVSSPVAGDVKLQVPPAGPTISDVLRFGPSNTLYFYSGGDPADSHNSTADTGLPAASNANTFTGVRGNNTFTYTPTAGQPGFDPNGWVVTYNFITEVSPIPEPASLMLLGLGGAALLVRRRKA